MRNTFKNFVNEETKNCYDLKVDFFLYGRHDVISTLVL